MSNKPIVVVPRPDKTGGQPKIPTKPIKPTK